MRLVRQSFVIILATLLAVLLFAPPLIGMYIQKCLTNKTFLSGLQEIGTVKVVSYHRGWFSSKAKYHVTVTDPQFSQFITKFGTVVSKPIEFFVQGYIQHGPIFYSPNHNQQLIFGLAAIDRKMIIPPEQVPVFRTIGIHESTIQNDQTYLSLLGKYIHYFKVGSYQLPTPDGLLIKFNSFQGKIWHWSFTNRVKGAVTLSDLSLSDGETSIEFSKVTDQFNVAKDSHGFWVGSQALTIPEIVLRDSGIKFLDINGIEFNTDLNEDNGLLEGDKKITLDQIRTEDKSIGPIEFHLSVARINAQAVFNLIETLQNIRRYGEMYESQLKQKILLAIPTLIGPGTSLKLNTLDIKTATGQLHMDANLSWPDDSSGGAENIPELIQTSNLEAFLRVSVPLANDLINALSDLTYASQISTPDMQKLYELRVNARLYAQQNISRIVDLVQMNEVSRNDGLRLLKLAYRRIPLSDYSDHVKKLLMEKKISRETSYLLNLQYAFLDQPTIEMKQMLAQYKEATGKLIHDQLNTFVKQGYVVNDKNEYSISIQRKGGTVKLNGQLLSAPDVSNP